MSTYNPDFCPRYHRAVELIGRRWSGVILRVMLTGATRFSEFKAAIPDMTDKVLSERLKELDGAGVIERRVYAETPVRIEYHLTEMGLDLEDAIRAISTWAERWLPIPQPA